MIPLLDEDIKIHKTKLLTETKFASKHAQPNNKKKIEPANPYLQGGLGKHRRSDSPIVRCGDATMHVT